MKNTFSLLIVAAMAISVVKLVFSSSGSFSLSKLRITFRK